MGLQQLVDIDAQLDRDIDRLAVAFEEDARRAFRAWLRRATSVVEALPAIDDRRRLSRSGTGLRQAARAEARFRAAMDAAGWTRTVDTGLRSLADVARTTARAIQAASGRRTTLRGLDALVLANFREVKRLELLELGDRLVAEAAEAVRRGAAANESIGSVLGTLQDLVDAKTNQARTIYDTALSEFSQTLQLLKARGAADEAFLYSGPCDSRIRRFCLARVYRVYTRAAIEAMDNGQLPNTLITRGGWNCRHQWRRVTDRRLVALADTGRVVSERLQLRIDETRADLTTTRGGLRPGRRQS